MLYSERGRRDVSKTSIGGQLTDNCERKAQNLRGKWRKSKPNELKCH